MMWKAVNNCLSVDERVRRVGIPMISKCNCCSRSKMEDLNHVLRTREFARRIWRLAATQLGVHRGVLNTWQEQINFWFHRGKISTQVRIIFCLLPSIVSW